MDFNKHYIRIDFNNIIIHGFSDAFEQPKVADICINEQGGRHFELNGVINPPLTTDSGMFKYKYVNGIVAERTVDELITLADAQAAKIAQLQQAANDYLKTFKSDALVTVHTYLSSEYDMTLLNGEYAYVQSNDYKGETISWYTVENGYTDHTGEQFRKVWLDGRANMRATKEKAEALYRQIMAATTINEVKAIEVVIP